MNQIEATGMAVNMKPINKQMLPLDRIKFNNNIYN